MSIAATAQMRLWLTTRITLGRAFRPNSSQSELDASHQTKQLTVEAIEVLCRVGQRPAYKRAMEKGDPGFQPKLGATV